MALEFLKKLVTNWAGAQAAMPISQLRRGMWVFVDIDDKPRGVVFQGVGILNAILPSGESEVHLVNEHGHTTSSTTVSPQWLRQADLKHIPEARRPHSAIADQFGYQ